jgi:cysteine sulfinate desulfinase/cysteine desulfurase-like protein
MQSIEEKINLYRQYSSSDLLIHSDASQSMEKVLIDVSRLYVDLLTICSHKFHDLKGFDALLYSSRNKIEINY